MEVPLRACGLLGSRAGREPAARPPAPGQHLVVTWRAAAVGMTVVAVVALGGLAVLASIKDVDVLATVALVLAVLAFISQLVISIAQAQAANQQLLGRTRAFPPRRPAAPAAAEAEAAARDLARLSDRALDGLDGLVVDEVNVRQGSGALGLPVAAAEDQGALRELEAAGLVARSAASGPVELTERGRQVGRIVGAPELRHWWRGAVERERRRPAAEPARRGGDGAAGP